MANSQQTIMYPIAIEMGSETEAYGVVVPDIEGCFSAGDTLEIALLNAKDAIESCLEFRKEEGLSLPYPSSVDVLASKMEQPLNYWLWTWIEIDITKQ